MMDRRKNDVENELLGVATTDAQRMNMVGSDAQRGAKSTESHDEELRRPKDMTRSRVELVFIVPP